MESESNRMFSVNDSGYDYDLHNLEDVFVQNIRFIKKEVDADGKFKIFHDGTTNEALIQVLLHRLSVLNAKMSSVHNEEAMRCLKMAFDALSNRTSERKQKGIEGTNLVN